MAGGPTTSWLLHTNSLVRLRERQEREHADDQRAASAKHTAAPPQIVPRLMPSGRARMHAESL
jgi:hypothetical protein